MEFRHINGTRNQRALVDQVVYELRYPWFNSYFLGEFVRFQFVNEPSVPGHNEFACVTYEMGELMEGPDGAIASRIWTVEVRNDLDDPGRDPSGTYTGPRFFMECVAHELGHVVLGVRGSSDLAVHFRHKTDTVGYPGRRGTVVDWSAGDWPERIEEAAAEVFKDAFLRPELRQFDNRTNWLIPPEDWQPYWTKLMCETSIAS